MGDSRQSVQVLQSQLDEFRDRSRRELQDAQRLSKDRLVEQQRAQALLKTTQEEVRQTRFHYIHIVLKYNIVFIVQKSIILGKKLHPWWKSRHCLWEYSHCSYPSAHLHLLLLTLDISVHWSFDLTLVWTYSLSVHNTDHSIGTLCVSQVSRLKKELLSCSEERDSSQLDKELLSSRLKHLENELEMERSSQTDRSREIRLIEVTV